MYEYFISSRVNTSFVPLHLVSLPLTPPLVSEGEGEGTSDSEEDLKKMVRPSLVPAHWTPDLLILGNILFCLKICRYTYVLTYLNDPIFYKNHLIKYIYAYI